MLDVALASKPTNSLPFGTQPPGVARSPVQIPTRRQSTGAIVSIESGSSEKVIIGASLIALVLVGLTGLVASFLTASISGQTAKLTAEVESIAGQLRTGPAATALERARTVEKQLGIAGTFAAQALPWPTILDELEALLPASTKLQSVGFDADGSLRLEGEVASNEDVAKLMTAIDESTTFGSATLSSLSLNESVDGSALIFSLTTQFQAPVVARTSTPEEAPLSLDQRIPSNQAGTSPDEQTASDVNQGGPDAGQ